MVSFTWALDGDGWSSPGAGRFTPGENPGTHRTGGWVGPRAANNRVVDYINLYKDGPHIPDHSLILLLL